MTGPVQTALWGGCLFTDENTEEVVREKLIGSDMHYMGQPGVCIDIKLVKGEAPWDRKDIAARPFYEISFILS